VAGENLAALIALWADAIWNRDAAAARRRLDPEVVWKGAVPGHDASGREAVLALLLEWDKPPRLTDVDAREEGAHALVFSHGPDLHAGGRAGPEGQSYLIFTFHKGLVTRIRSFATRDEALRAVAQNRNQT
jgi:ketosteroid isomerase-like protein